MNASYSTHKSPACPGLLVALLTLLLVSACGDGLIPSVGVIDLRADVFYDTIDVQWTDPRGDLDLEYVEVSWDHGGGSVGIYLGGGHHVIDDVVDKTTYTIEVTGVRADGTEFGKDSLTATTLTRVTGTDMRTPSIAVAYDESCHDVALSGNWAAVATGNGNSGNPGFVTIYEYDSFGGWSESDTLDATDVPDSFDFGESVDIDGAIVVAGDPSDGTPGMQEGAVYIHERDADGTWSRIDTILPSTVNDGQSFGESLSISGQVLVVGAPSFDDGTLGGAGRVYVFEPDEFGSYKETAVLDPPEPVSFLAYGTTVDTDGQTIAVSTAEDMVYLYAIDADDDWVLTDTLTLPPALDPAGFGQILSVSGDLVAVGVPGHDAVCVFTRDGAGEWSYAALLRPHEPGYFLSGKHSFGSAVQVSGNTVAVGAPYDHWADDDFGAIYLFSPDGSSGWTDYARLRLNVPTDPHSLGKAFDLNPSWLVAGLPNWSDTRYRVGAAAFFDLSDL